MFTPRSFIASILHQLDCY